MVVNGKVESVTDAERLELWVLIDHGKEGIQAINMDVENQEFLSYVKKKD